MPEHRKESFKNLVVNITSPQITALIILGLGIALRVHHLWQINVTEEPFQLGGLFVAFAEQIAQKNFSIPDTVCCYSNGGIPFAYPPLGFFLEAVFIVLFPNRQIFIANVLPPIISTSTLFLAYPVILDYFKGDRWKANFALFAFAFIPNSFTNQVEAAGLAEAVGSMALLFLFWFGIRFIRTISVCNSFLMGLALAVCVLSSPGSAIGAALVSLVVGMRTILANKFSARSFIHIFIILVTGLMVSSPYWLTVWINHGPTIFITPLYSQFQGNEGTLSNLVGRFINFSVVDWGGTFFWNIIIFIGLIWSFTKDRWFILVSFFLLNFIPRENIWIVTFPASILFAHGVIDGFHDLLHYKRLARYKKLIIGFIFVMFSMVEVSLSFQYISLLKAETSWDISSRQIKELRNASPLIPTDTKVIVIGNDGFLEWSPYFLNREVLNTKFGLEWELDEFIRVSVFNDNFSTFRNWGEVIRAASHLGEFLQLAVVSSDKQVVFMLNQNSSDKVLKLIFDGECIQVGLLSK